ncbi:type II toxin-antitoxin system RelE/ParE family toxin [Aerophototrophica crusticola]|uniref:Type II toxin-antitoxin system RelE/ParE family toxin n=1 Tax=Aerophototrophica crusticola TaxID=1709002 RepID=A0A858RA08_9PROT|nr:type II toxin-antitoxin system RelE/ParE family toxin [Rhodospirillaceae bacterium B3]
MREPKPVYWVGSGRKDVRAFPEDIRDAVGFALFAAQTGGKHPHAKPLAGFGSAGVLEIVEDGEGDTYRCVYTVRFSDAVYVLHAFQKKSKRGIETPQSEIALVRSRLKLAEDHYRGRRSG